MGRGISMESIIQINEGDIPNPKSKCFFCDKEAPFSFGIINANKMLITYDKMKEEHRAGFVMNGVSLCEQHAEAFNSLLSGEHDVNDLITVMKSRPSRKINLRR